MTDLNENAPKKKRTPRDWESAIEKTIREAMERGEFDNLVGQGKPQDLNPNPFVPEELRQAFRILQNADVAPDWIESDKEIRAEKAALANFLEQQTQWFVQRKARAKSFAADQMIAEHEHLARSREQIVARFRERALALNKIIDTFNLKAPASTRHHERVQIEANVAKFLDAIK